MNQETNFEKIFQLDLVLLLVSDNKGNIVKVNQAWEFILGYTEKELLGRSFLEFIHPEDLEATGAQLELLNQFRAVSRFVNRYRCKDGTYKTLEWNAQPDRDLNYGIARDITEMIQATEEIRKQRERFALAVEGSSDGIWDLDLLTGEHYFSPRWKELLGYQDTELLNETNTLEQLLHPEDRSVTMRSMEDFITAGDTIWDREFRLRHKDGSYRWIHARGKAFLDQQGRVCRMAGSHTDITQVKLAAETSRLSEVRYRAILDKTPFPIVIARVSDGTLRYGNARAKKQFGFIGEEGIGLPTSQFYQDQEARAKFLQMLKDQGVIYDYELEMLNWHGEPYTALVSASFVDFEGALGIMVSINDITDRKKAEEEIRYLSRHDHLTGLYNRHFYATFTEKTLPPELLPLTLIVADVNGLKLANDAFGHSFGDQLLIRFAEVLKRNRSPLDLAIRIGGDEFVLLIPNAGEEEANAIIQRIEADCEGELIDNIGLSASLGFYVFADASVPPQDGYKLAEDAMYRQKMVVGSRYRNNVVNGIIEDVFLRNPDDRVHSEEVERICRTLGTALAMQETELNDLMLAARLHDIGKIGVDASLTDLDETLDAQPNEEFKKHSPVGYYILHSASDYAHIAEMVLAHHERADGSGYPKGLFLDQIPLQARIIQLANDLDLMQRKNGWSKDNVMAYLKQNSGKIYDPALVQVLIATIM